MKKVINIKLFQQEAGTQDCGPVCVQMIFDRFAIKKEFDALKNSLKFYENGTSVYDNGSLLLAAGLKVTAVTAQPYLFSPDLIPSLNSKEEVIKRIDFVAEKRVKFKEGLETMKKFLNDGGELKIEIPSFKHIRDTIDNDGLVIALLYGQALGSKEGGFHFVVVSGYDDGAIFVNNPSTISKGQAWFPSEDFFYGVHTSTSFDIDNGTLLLISN